MALQQPEEKPPLMIFNQWFRSCRDLSESGPKFCRGMILPISNSHLFFLKPYSLDENVEIITALSQVFSFFGNSVVPLNLSMYYHSFIHSHYPRVQLPAASHYVLLLLSVFYFLCRVFQLASLVLSSSAFYSMVRTSLCS